MNFSQTIIIFIFLISCNNIENEGIELKCLNRNNEVVFEVKNEDILGVDWNNQSFLINKKKSELIFQTNSSLFGLYYKSKLIYFINIANPYNSNKQPKFNAPYVVFSELDGALVENWFIVQPYSYKTDSNLKELVFNNDLFSFVQENKLLYKNWELSRDSIVNELNLNFIEDFKRKFPNQKMAFKFPDRFSGNRGSVSDVLME